MLENDASDINPGGLLSDATLLALQLQHQPFTSQLQSAQTQHEDDTQVIGEPFSDTVTEEQLADVKQALITGDDLLLILGDDGSGKSTLLKQLSANSGLRIQCFAVTGSERFSTLNLFAGMLEAFKREPAEKLKDILDELVPCLQSMVGRNTLSVVVLDDAHKASKSELTQLLNSMLYMNGQDETLLRVALSASGDFEEGISELLPEGADLPYSSLTIEGLSTERATAYLDYRLSLAGYNEDFPFTERDMASLVEHSAGMPAKLHTLTADVLNEKYGRLESTLPRELGGGAAAGWLQSRKAKLALGAIATVLILGGILMFLPGGERTPEGEESTQSVVISEQPVNTQTPSPASTDSGESATDEPQTPITTAANEVPRPPESAAGNPPALQSEDSTENSPESPEDSTADTNPGEPDANLQGSNDATNVSDTSTSTDSENQSTLAQNTGTDAQTIAEATQSNVETAIAAQESGTNDTAQTDTSDVATAPSDDELLPPQPPVQELPDTSQEADPGTQTLETVDTNSIDEPTEELLSDTPANESSELSDDIVATLLEPPSWIVIQEDSQYTVQMTASRDLPSVENFLRVHRLPRPNSIFSFERDGDVWYALVHGIFSTQAEAQRVVERMPAAVQRDQPWIRSISRIKAILR